MAERIARPKKDRARRQAGPSQIRP